MVGGVVVENEKDPEHPCLVGRWWAGKPDRSMPLSDCLSEITVGIHQAFAPWHTACPADITPYPRFSSDRLSKFGVIVTVVIEYIESQYPRCRFRFSVLKGSMDKKRLAFVPQTCKNPLRVILDPSSHLLAFLHSEIGISIHGLDGLQFCFVHRAQVKTSKMASVSCSVLKVAVV